MKGATSESRKPRTPPPFQSTPPRRERHREHQETRSAHQISIHAPAKGATGFLLGGHGFHGISIHAPAKGATERGGYGGNRGYFNPRSREGSDQRTVHCYHPWHNFNPRSREGSDDLQTAGVPINVAFQSTLPRRERRAQNRVSCRLHKFQSTLPRRERHVPAVLCTAQRYFNPRSREGSDGDYLVFLEDAARISIHAPEKGATAKITKTIPNDFCKINNYNNSFA